MPSADSTLAIAASTAHERPGQTAAARMSRAVGVGVPALGSVIAGPSNDDGRTAAATARGTAVVDTANKLRTPTVFFIEFHCITINRMP